MEKEQVIKLIRTIVEVGTVRNEFRGAGGCGTVPLSGAVMRAFVAVAEHAEDPFRLICIQTLAEICKLLNIGSVKRSLTVDSTVVIDTALVARTGGIRFLLHALGEGPLEIAPILASAFLHIIDSPRTRAYLQVGTDLEVLVLQRFVVCVNVPVDGIFSRHRRVREGARSRRQDERMYQSNPVDVTLVEW
jgi:large subunit ribosomal protein L17e